MAFFLVFGVWCLVFGGWKCRIALNDGKLLVGLNKLLQGWGILEGGEKVDGVWCLIDGECFINIFLLEYI